MVYFYLNSTHCDQRPNDLHKQAEIYKELHLGK